MWKKKKDIKRKKGGLNVSTSKQTITEERIREIIREEIIKNLSCTFNITKGDIDVTLSYGEKEFTKGKDYFYEIVKVLKEFNFIG